MSFFSWYHLNQQHAVLDCIESHRTIEEPQFAERVILGYLDTKRKRGMSTMQISEKLHSLEVAISQRRDLPDFTTLILSIRTTLSLPASRVYPRRNRRTTTALRPPTYTPIARPAPQPTLYLPTIAFKEEASEGLPAYSLVDEGLLRERESLV